MEKRDDSSLRIWPVILVLLLSAGAYVGSYYMLLKGAVLVVEHRDGSAFVLRRPHYKVQSQMVKRIFVPAHWLDRAVRPDSWPEQKVRVP
jgi:hypothetical protein